MIWLRMIAVTTPPAAARLVFMKILATEEASSIVPMASCEPPLKPNQPSQRMKVPSVASGIEEPGSALTLPSSEYLPLRAPMIRAPVRAAQPPTEWTRVEPAKSEKPISASQPPPHCQAPVIG